MSADRFRLGRRLQNAQQKAVSDDVLEKLSQDIERSVSRRALRAANLPQVSYPPLPVSDRKDDIKQAIANNQVVIVAGETLSVI